MAPVAVDEGSHVNGTLTNGDAHPTNGTHQRAPSSYAQKFNLAAHFIGGNQLEAAPPGFVKDFVTNHDGHSVVTSVSTNQATYAFRGDWLTIQTGAHREQWYCGGQGNPVGAEMGLRDVSGRAGCTIYGHGNTGGLASKCGLHSDGRSICRGQ